MADSCHYLTSPIYRVALRCSLARAYPATSLSLDFHKLFLVLTMIDNFNYTVKELSQVSELYLNMLTEASMVQDLAPPSEELVD